MNLFAQRNHPRSAGSRPVAGRLRSLAAFTMVEIALSLAIIGFALVAIIGILPAGMSVQKDNREQTMINFDASYIMDLIRSGARGPDSLTNYIISITNIYTLCGTNGAPIGTPTTNWFTTNQTYVNGSLYSYSILTNGNNIVGLLGAPKYVPINNYNNYYSNSVAAEFRAFSGPAVDQGRSQAARDFAFSYRVNVEVLPVPNYPYFVTEKQDNSSDPLWINFTAPAMGSDPLATISESGGHRDERHIAQQLQNNLHQIRLRFQWPILAGGKVGGGRMVLRSASSGQRDDTGTNMLGITGLRFYFIQPNNYKEADNSP